MDARTRRWIVAATLAGASVVALPGGTAVAQRAGYGAGAGQRPVTPGARGGSSLGGLRRESLLRSSTAPSARVRQQTTIARAELVLGDRSASASDLRTAGEQASHAYEEMGADLAARGDHTAAAGAFVRAASSRWARNDVDMRFRSSAWTRAARSQTAVGDRRAAAESLRRAAEALDHVGTESDQVQAANLYREEAAIHAELGDGRSRSDALVGASEALRRAGDIVTDSHQRFDRGAPSTWPESEHVLRARAHEHYTASTHARDTASHGYRAAGLGFWAARRALSNPRPALQDPPAQPSTPAP